MQLRPVATHIGSRLLKSSAVGLAARRQCLLGDRACFRLFLHAPDPPARWLDPRGAGGGLRDPGMAERQGRRAAPGRSVRKRPDAGAFRPSGDAGGGASGYTSPSQVDVAQLVLQNPPRSIDPAVASGEGPLAASVHVQLQTVDGHQENAIDEVHEYEDEDTPDTPYDEHTLGTHVPLPLGDEKRDVDEIEVPGLARDPDIGDDADRDTPIAQIKRRNSFSGPFSYVTSAGFPTPDASSSSVERRGKSSRTENISLMEFCLYRSGGKGAASRIRYRRLDGSENATAGLIMEN